MMVIEQPKEKTILKNIKMRKPFKLSGEEYTYVKYVDKTMLNLNTGEISPAIDTLECLPFRELRPVVLPVHDCAELKRQRYEDVEGGECFLFHDAFHIKTSDGRFYTLADNSIGAIMSDEEVTLAPFIGIELL